MRYIIPILFILFFSSCDNLLDTNSSSYEFNSLSHNNLESVFNYTDIVQGDTLLITTDSVKVATLPDSITTRSSNDIVSSEQARIYFHLKSQSDSLVTIDTTSYAIICNFDRNNAIEKDSRDLLTGAVTVSELTFIPDSINPASNFFNVEDELVIFYPGFGKRYIPSIDSAFQTLR